MYNERISCRVGARADFLSRKLFRINARIFVIWRNSMKIPKSVRTPRHISLINNDLPGTNRQGKCCVFRLNPSWGRCQGAQNGRLYWLFAILKKSRFAAEWMPARASPVTTGLFIYPVMDRGVLLLPGLGTIFPGFRKRAPKSRVMNRSKILTIRCSRYRLVGNRC